ncbi:dockerin type I repeat-containing protein [uncultured Ruminococcus sp.]|uniref:dockerin type I repeat-containing protein n=1 Tax=uncultured Ruminococcus sp. TaxID=165186 RepID=UPI0025CEE36C|nr:dockerin type I repeat-containing protein [uncultured Ruminococcus sp.]
MGNKKIAAVITAAAMISSTALTVSAEEKEGFTASIGLASSDLSVQNWESSLNIKEGTNTVTFTPPKDKKGVITSLKGIGLLVIDLEDCYYEVGEVSVDKVLIDGNELSFDNDLIIYGADDGADNDNFRIELFSSFGDTKDNAPFDVQAVTVSKSVEVTFTVRRGENSRPVTLCGNVVANKHGKSAVPLTDISVDIKEHGADDHTTDEQCTVEGSSFTANIRRGVYDFTISRDGYVTRTIEGVKAGKKKYPAELKDVDLRTTGDVNGDGVINVTDISIVSGYVKQIKGFSDSYQAKVADVNRDSAVNVTDISSIAGAVKGIKKL